MLLNTSKYVPTFGMKRVATPQKSGSAPGRHCAGPTVVPSKDSGLHQEPSLSLRMILSTLSRNALPWMREFLPTNSGRTEDDAPRNAALIPVWRATGEGKRPADVKRQPMRLSPFLAGPSVP